jgi:hypothetical protein
MLLLVELSNFIGMLNICLSKNNTTPTLGTSLYKVDKIHKKQSRDIGIGITALVIASLIP